jgi:hypothetical protein
MIKQIKVFQCTCERCGHCWTTKTDALPVRCAKCNVTTWNKPRNEGIKQAIDSNKLDIPNKSMESDGVDVVEMVYDYSLDEVS